MTFFIAPLPQPELARHRCPEPDALSIDIEATNAYISGTQSMRVLASRLIVRQSIDIER
jgi:hypothetical protein